MKKLIRGIVEFRQKVQKGYRESFGGLASGQSPDTLFVACSDSRVVPNTFASTNPGDLFVIRNVGNLIPPCGKHGVTATDKSEAAAIEFSVLSLRVLNVIICGHSECGAMRALVDKRSRVEAPNLKSWLRHGDLAHDQIKSGIILEPSLTADNKLSQLNVLQQIEHVKSYPAVQEAMRERNLVVHGWWFDITTAEVYAYEEDVKKFVLIDETEAERLISRLET